MDNPTICKYILLLSFLRFHKEQNKKKQKDFNINVIFIYVYKYICQHISMNFTPIFLTPVRSDSIKPCQTNVH